MKCFKEISVLCYVLVAVCSLCIGCVKEPEFWDGNIPEGDTDIDCNIVFEPLVEKALATRATNAPAGDTLNDINDLCILFFDKEGKLIEDGIREVRRTDMTFVDNPGYATDRHARFSLRKVPYGEYYMFAVANLGNPVKTSKATVQTTTYQVLDGMRQNGGLATVDDLKGIQLTWDPESIDNNAEMLGYFTAGEAPGNPTSFYNAQSVVINRSKMTFHSWLCRAASKVTIEFDPSGMRNNIRIYLKSARLRHIPLHCPLGEKNVPASDEDLIPDTESPYFHIDYYPEKTRNDRETWMVLARGGILDGTNGAILDEYDGMHTPTAKALFFYENMQGEGKDKGQDSDRDGELDYPGHNTNPADSGYMDKKPYGTYVEIEAHYVSNAPGNYGQGKIFYRFMLGKDTEKDYNAERNNHYKLTLKFNGNANDVDWHIDYTPESDILYAPDPYYISYLYNQTMDLPLYVSGKLQQGDHIDLKIIKNGWGPADPDTLKKMYPFELYGKAADKLCNGFLSLKPSTQASGVVADPNSSTNNYLSNYNYTYWYDVNNGNLGNKTIKYEELRDAMAKEGAVKVPLYTREKQLVKPTGFTGNNIYPQYRREAILEVSGVIGGKAVEKKEIKVYQMHRIINPSGVFRNHDSQKPFELTMAFRTSPEAPEFQPLHSIGPWRAQINVGEGWEIVDADENGIISGDDGSKISFNVKPIDVIDENDTKCAYVDIAYNNYTCHHRVILRQGDKPLALVDKGSEWYYRNLLTKDELAPLPIDEGSLFKYGNEKEPISSENQKTSNIGAHANDLKIEGGGNLPWTEIGYSIDAKGFSETVFLDGKATAASFDDFKALYLNADISFKFGILYGDDAPGTEFDAEKAVGYNQYNNPEKSNGMRGVFVYNSKDGRSIFFPVGCTGYGRRKDQNPNEKVGGFQKRGVLRYAQRSPEKPWGDGYANYAPLFYYIHEFEGAIYWLDRQVVVPAGFSNTGYNTNAWDINFRTFDFNHFLTDGAYKDQKTGIEHCDAAFIRCVVKK
ncbi:MAG: hypothetical protein NC115_11975 [Bacteroidales bacterium]|nr:hypothetical protein [Bacteroidales bacterium]